MTNDEVMAVLRSDTPLNKARAILSSHAAHMEQASQQRKPLSPIEWRRIEIEATKKIAAALGVTL